MDLNFNKVSYDGDLTDFSEDELQELVEKFETAQESNVAEFQTAAEALDDVDEETIEDFETAREGLIEDIVEAEAFEDVPLTEEKLEAEAFSELQEWKTFVAAQATEDETDEPEDDEGDFDDFGQKAPTEGEDEMEDFVEDNLGSMQGLNLQ